MSARTSTVRNTELQDLEDLKNNLLHAIKVAESEQRLEDVKKIKDFLERYEHLLVNPEIAAEKKMPLDLAPYKIKDKNALALTALAISLAIFGVFEPNVISTTLAYIVLVLLVAKDKI